VTGADHARVCELLGREPRGRYDVVVRDESGDPVVLRNAPLLDDGTPMPTRFWLIGPEENRRIGRLESAGGVDRAESEVDAEELAAAHARYAAERDAAIPTDHGGPRPSGGVGGTRVGVKCLHAHWAWHLAGGDDPVGRWIEAALDTAPEPDSRLHLHVASDTIEVGWQAVRASLPLGSQHIVDRWLTDDDPPRPESLTNALGEVVDHLDDVVREHPAIAEVGEAFVTGPGTWAIAQLESGLDAPVTPFSIDRDTAEEIFRLAATERRDDRRHNPGLPSGDVDLVLGSLCVVIGAMRRLSIHDVTIPRPDTAS
jgi:uncharacterized protein